MRSLAPALQKMAGIEPQPASVFPRPEPNYSGKRPLDFKSLVKAMNSMSMDRILALNKLLLTATVPEIQQLLKNGEPYGLVMVGNANSEADLITAGYVLEQTVKGRKLPDLDKTIEQMMKLQQ